MSKKISVVINSWNEEKNIERAIKSVTWADEIVLCDMYSNDKTVTIAKNLGAKVCFYKYTAFVEPARNFAISKASNDWILILDADEEIPNSLSDKLRKMVERSISSDFVEIPRKNIIFGKWMNASMWWPDYQIRFFKKGSVVWGKEIHKKPQTFGEGLKLEPQEDWAIVHHNYQNISQFIDRMNRYTTIEADQLKKQNVKFRWEHLIEKPVDEFLSRFFANGGHKDGLHGLALSLLQAFSFLITYLKVWENEKFEEEDIKPAQLQIEAKKSGKALNYWFKNVESQDHFFWRFLKIFKS